MTDHGFLGGRRSLPSLKFAHMAVLGLGERTGCLEDDVFSFAPADHPVLLPLHSN